MKQDVEMTFGAFFLQAASVMGKLQVLRFHVMCEMCMSGQCHLQKFKSISLENGSMMRRRNVL